MDDVTLPAGIVAAAERRDIGLVGGAHEPNPSPDGGSRPTPSDEAAERVVCKSAWEL